MKKILFFALMFILFNANFYAQSTVDWRIHPDDATYKIEGYFETTFTNGGKVSYELTNVVPHGLSFPIEKKYFGGLTNAGNVYFTFDRVKYNGSPDFDNIALWIYDETLGKWVADIETGKQENKALNTNEMTIMLVLDCSSSLIRKGSNGLEYNGLEDVKKSAKSFIEIMLNSSSAGNIHIGIIGFSSMKETRILPLQSLNSNSANEMKNFINSFKPGNGTALYKSFDQAVDITQEYVKKLNKFAGSAIVTFTDGLDNGSNNFEKRIGSKQAYFKYIQEEVLNREIGGHPFQSYTIFVPDGDDVKDPAVKKKIVQELQILAKQDGCFYEVHNTSDLENKFNDIAESLIDSWKVLSCFISSGQNGKVCWTFGKQYIPAVTPKPTKPTKPQPLYGVNLGLGLPIESSRICSGAGLDFQAGFDFAYPLRSNFAIGCYASIGGGFTGGSGGSYTYTGGMFKFSAGLLMEIGDLNYRPFIVGFSPCIGYGISHAVSYVPIELRFGRFISDNWYMMGDLVLGFGEGFCFEPTFRVGYKFGN